MQAGKIKKCKISYGIKIRIDGISKIRFWFNPPEADKYRGETEFRSVAGFPI